LISTVFALSIVVPIFQIVVVVFLASHLGSFRAFASFSPWGVGLNVASADQQLHLQSLAQIPLDTLSVQQRFAVAALDGLCATCTALALFHLRRLFVLYSRGVVFAEENIRHIKSLGMWLIVAAIAINVAGRLFERVTQAVIYGTSNAALIVVLGAMIYVIAYVMELGREADLERKDFL
jgi:undecaprenyl pyrophosphate phosphatase UppP